MSHHHFFSMSIRLGVIKTKKKKNTPQKKKQHWNVESIPVQLKLCKSPECRFYISNTFTLDKAFRCGRCGHTICALFQWFQSFQRQFYCIVYSVFIPSETDAISIIMGSLFCINGKMSRVSLNSFIATSTFAICVIISLKEFKCKCLGWKLYYYVWEL